MAGEIPPILVQLQADVSQLKAGLQQAEAALKNLDGNVEKSATGFSRFTERLKSVGAALGATFAATQVIQFFKDSVAAAVEAESAQTRLREILLNTGGATEAQVVALQAQAAALSKVGVASKENITITQSQLATFDLQGKTISKLTPAILDYVIAEKGATASSDDFKSMTNGLAQALQGNFASLTRVGFVLDEDTKKKIKNGTESERAAALTEVLNSTYKDFNKTVADTPEGRMIKLKQEFSDLQQEIGEALLPAMEGFARVLNNVVLPGIKNLIKFVKNNIDEIKAFIITLGLGATAWGIYTVAVNRAKIAQAALNLVQKANPIGAIITGVALLVAGFVKLWNSSETFRNAMIAVAKVGVIAFGGLVTAIIKVFEAIVKGTTGPMRIFLEALSKLPGVGKFAKAGLDLINKGIDGLSDFGDKAAAKTKELTARLDGMAKTAKKAKEETDKVAKSGKDVWAGSKDPSGPMSADEKKRLDKLKGLKEKARDILKDMADVQAEAGEDLAKAELDRDERIADAKARYTERVSDLMERYQERLVDIDERYGEQVAEATKRRDESIAEARERFRKQELDIQKDYNKKRLEIEASFNSQVRDLQLDAEKKRQDVLAAGQAKLAEIVEKGRERLRSAWESGTAFSLKDLFAAAKDKGGSVLDALKAQLTQTRDFQKQIGELAGQGYTQTFIEQIAKAGPAAGSEMLAQLKKLTPEQQGELQSLYMALEDLNTSGMDEIAKSLSTSTSFATAELADMYDKAQKEITSSLAQVNSELNRNLAQAKAAYEFAMADAARIRDERLAEARDALMEALAEADKTYNESLAKAKTELNKALLDAKKDLDKGLLDAQKELNKGIEEAMKAFEKNVDEINKRTAKKLAELQAKMAEIAAAMASLGAMQAAKAATTAGNAVTLLYKPPSAVGGFQPPPGAAEWREGERASMQNLTVNQTFNQVSADAWDVHEKTLAAIRYGQAVTPKPTPQTNTPVTSGGRTGGGGRYEMQVM